MKIFKQSNKPGERNYRYNTSVFLICLVISAIFWLLVKFADENQTDISIPVKYTGIPHGKQLVGNPDSILTINIKSSGFGLLRFKYLMSEKPFLIHLSNNQLIKQNNTSTYSIGTISLAQQIIDLYRISGSIEYVSPETVVLRFEDQQSKLVPVIPELSYTLMKQYYAYDSLKIDPKYVEIKGVEESISNIFFVKTEPLKFDNLTVSIQQKVRLQVPDSKYPVEIYPDEVNLFLPVEKYTEAEIQIPVETKNTPPGIRVKLFPEKVTVFCMVALKDFKRLEPSLFTCAVDLAELRGESRKRLKCEIYASPSFVKIQRLVPADVEYIILK
ncbi:MAG: hypothetical protein EOM06_05175 [Sphingobacteriia bacterium]|nr:hypothetical protein [Sphingobacteriia bacterium]